MLNRRPRRQINQMNVVPYIDVMLVLLVIFMVTTPLFTPGLVDVPSVSRARAPEQKPIQVLVDKDGAYALTLDGDKDTKPYASLNELIAAIKALGDQERTVALEADQNLKYKDVIKVADELHKQGIKKVALTVATKTGGQ
jgi:biopolymer transport protein TolR